MIIKKRTLILASVALVLLLLNLVRWWPEAAETAMFTANDDDTSIGFDPKSLALTYHPSKTPASQAYRDLFSMQTSLIQHEMSKPDKATTMAITLPKTTVLPYRMMGVVTRGQALQAFILSGDITHVLRVGDTLDTQYRVIAIKNDSVRLQNLSTDEQTQINLVGP